MFWLTISKDIDTTFQISSTQYTILWDYCLGKGCFGSVYKGLYNNQYVAVKRCVLSKKLLEKTMQEVEILARLRHRNIVSVYGYCILGKEGDECVSIDIIMELGEWDLEHFIHSKASEDDGISEETQVAAQNPQEYLNRKRYIYEICKALAFMFTKNICHGDLKQDNILVSRDGTVMITDFGMAKFTNKDLTQSIVNMGNLLHLDPNCWRVLTEIEDMKPEEVQRLLLHADAYAFGMLVIEILTGYFPLLRYKDGDKKTLTNTNWGFLMEMGYRVRVNSVLKKDEIIYGIVTDCMKEENERPEMPEIFKRVEDWYKRITVCIWYD